jgi:hypothetical protein
MSGTVIEVTYWSNDPLVAGGFSPPVKCRRSIIITLCRIGHPHYRHDYWFRYLGPRVRPHETKHKGLTIALVNRWPRESRIAIPQTQSAFIRSHNETLSVAAMRVSYKDRPPARIHCRDAAPTPTGSAEIISDYFPVLHALRSLTTEILWRKENFACVRIFNRGSRRKTSYVDVTAI